MRGNKDGKAMKPILKSKLKLAVLAPPCMLSPGLQAERKQGRHWGYPFIELIMRYGVDIELLPCPESTFKGYSSGLRRNKHGIDYYTHLDGYKEHCIFLAKQSADLVADMQGGGYKFIYWLGVEHSPTCAATYMYSCHGMLKRQGIFYECLQEELKLRGIIIPQKGINRTYLRKALVSLEQALLSEGQTEKDDLF